MSQIDFNAAAKCARVQGGRRSALSSQQDLAAERTGRACYGIELDPLYVDTIIRRWQAYAGEITRHAVSGQSFAELAKERGA